MFRMVKLHEGGRHPSRNTGTLRGVKVPVVRGRHRPPFHFTHPLTSTAIGAGVFRALHVWDGCRKPLEAILAPLG